VPVTSENVATMFASRTRNLSADETANVKFLRQHLQPLLYAVRPEPTEFGAKRKITVITPFKVIQGHRFWYQSKPHVRLPISY